MLLELNGMQASDVEDRFIRIEDDAALPASGAVLVSLTRLLEEKKALLARADALGVWLRSDESPEAIADLLGEAGEKLEVIALDFPAFADGRAFSSARLLRERYGFKGQVRAIGEVLCEQLPFMIRSGFDAFEMQSATALKDFKAIVGEVRVVYQPTGDGRRTALDERLGRNS